MKKVLKRLKLLPKLTRFVLSCCLLMTALEGTPPPMLAADTQPKLNSQTGPQSQPPTNFKYNLVSIVTDDQALWSIGAYGNREAIMPNMDRLAREGVKFNNAFVTSPSVRPAAWPS